jgi:ATP-dependent RNA helicase DDX19/DBP5
MGKYTRISSELAIPCMGKTSTPQSKRPPIMSQVVIGTPGTIKNCMIYKKLEMTRLKILVFDEADQMFAMVNFVLGITGCIVRYLFL